ncbi:uncharacterized protein LOC122162456 [Centrocercus urophasianus]|uniref:uncharacterized protein LOC122162456 n=1 Tax=Centrocercus urophasianus TaxID=9002 RepID=UPI001C650170|nr:uncharacterized protein LOC122162456 [Centrocercus urophasianus]
MKLEQTAEGHKIEAKLGSYKPLRRFPGQNRAATAREVQGGIDRSFIRGTPGAGAVRQLSRESGGRETGEGCHLSEAGDFSGRTPNGSASSISKNCGSFHILRAFHLQLNKPLASSSLQSLNSLFLKPSSFLFLSPFTVGVPHYHFHWMFVQVSSLLKHLYFILSYERLWCSRVSSAVLGHSQLSSCERWKAIVKSFCTAKQRMK